MKPSLSIKLAQLATRLEELNGLLGAEDATRDLDRYRALTREHAEITPVVALYREWEQGERDLAAAQEMLAEEIESMVTGIFLNCEKRMECRPRAPAVGTAEKTWSLPGAQLNPSGPRASRASGSD